MFAQRYLHYVLDTFSCVSATQIAFKLIHSSRSRCLKRSCVNNPVVLLYQSCEKNPSFKTWLLPEFFFARVSILLLKNKMQIFLPTLIVINQLEQSWWKASNRFCVPMKSIEAFPLSSFFMCTLLTANHNFVFLVEIYKSAAVLWEARKKLSERRRAIRLQGSSNLSCRTALRLCSVSFPHLALLLGANGWLLRAVVAREQTCLD